MDIADLHETTTKVRNHTVRCWLLRGNECQCGGDSFVYVGGRVKLLLVHRQAAINCYMHNTDVTYI